MHQHLTTPRPSQWWMSRRLQLQPPLRFLWLCPLPVVCQVTNLWTMKIPLVWRFGFGWYFCQQWAKLHIGFEKNICKLVTLPILDLKLIHLICTSSDTGPHELSTWIFFALVLPGTMCTSSHPKFGPSRCPQYSHVVTSWSWKRKRNVPGRRRAWPKRMRRTTRSRRVKWLKKDEVERQRQVNLRWRSQSRCPRRPPKPVPKGSLGPRNFPSWMRTQLRVMSQWSQLLSLRLWSPHWVTLMMCLRKPEREEQRQRQRRKQSLNRKKSQRRKQRQRPSLEATRMRMQRVEMSRMKRTSKRPRKCCFSLTRRTMMRSARLEVAKKTELLMPRLGNWKNCRRSTTRMPPSSGTSPSPRRGWSRLPQLLLCLQFLRLLHVLTKMIPRAQRSQRPSAHLGRKTLRMSPRAVALCQEWVQASQEDC